MQIEAALKSPRKMGLMAYVNRAADDPQKRKFTVSLWLKSGQKYEGLSVNVPGGGYTQQDMVLEGDDNGYALECFLWGEICGLIVNWK